MKTIQLKPIPRQVKVMEEVERKINRLLLKELYIPLLRELSDDEPISSIQNSDNDVIVEAIRSGRLTHHRGKFSGRLNAQISKALRLLGAKWDRKTKNYSHPLSQLPFDITHAIAVSEFRFVKKMESINRRLANIDSAEIASKLHLDKIIDKAIYRVEAQLKDSLGNITIQTHFTDEQRAKIARDYTLNMQLDIKGWTDARVKNLRKKVEPSTQSGLRYEEMVSMIRKDYRVSQSKAKFLARQETNLLLCKYKETRYLAAGVKKYKWKCVNASPQHPVRPMHEALGERSKKGELFSFENPPQVSKNPARFENPGEDFNCRCVAIPVVIFEK
jgi:SPP1 gp7 family putative phage head morphogenesis protein